MNAQHLKSSILRYAMQGKLVPQNPDDEPAIELLGRIQKEKEKLIQENVVKKGKALPPISNEAVPFDIPINWEWVRLGDITSKITDGVHKTPKYLNDGVPFLSVKNISKGYLDMSDIKYVSRDAHEEMIKRCNPEKGDILFCRIGTLGKPLMIREDVEFSIFVSLGLLKMIDKSIAPFIELAMKSPVFYDQINEVKVSGSHTNKINLRDIPNLLIPLPPLNEQERIISKLESMNNKIEKFDSDFQDLDALKRSFPTKLENSILHYAMQGKLVEQEETDEPAAELIERIRKEKEILIKEKVLKKEKTLPPITDEEVPFDIPENWEWIRIKDITNFGNASTITPEKINAEDWVLDLEEIEKNTGRIIDKKLAKEKSVKSNKYRFAENEVLYGKLRPYLNKVAIAPEDGYCTTEIIPLKLYGNVDVRYVQLVLMSPYFIGYANSCSYGVKMPRLGTQQIANALIPLPPLKEQKRIVNRVESLFCITDKLK